MITRDELSKIMPHAGRKVDDFIDHLNASMQEYEIDNPNRISAFLAQLAHESGELRYVKEIASGAAYEGRKDLGNTEPGDGIKYRGRGLIQITGRSNYSACSQALFGDDTLIQNPEILESPKEACRSAAWFWKTRNLNDLADKEDFRTITRRINGGLNGYPDRWEHYCRAREVLEA